MGLGVLLAAPSLTAGLVADDHLQRLAARAAIAGEAARPWDLFAFADGVDGAAKIADGRFPWWADPGVKMAFFRPLAALTHLADAALWPDAPALMHAQSLAWFALALAAVGLLYRELSAPWAAWLALLLYAVDDAHGPAVGWVANRNALIAVALGVPAVVLWRRGRSWAAGGAMFLALLAGEAAFGALALVAGIAWHRDDRPWRDRLSSLSGLAIAVAAWAALSRGLGYGVARSGVYVDPTGDPLRFLVAAAARAPMLLVAQLGGPWSDLTQGAVMFEPRATPWVVGACWATVLMVAALFAAWLRDDRQARAWATAMVLAAVPVCGAFASDRLLLFVGIGAMGLVARGVEVATSRWGRRAAVAALVLHGGIAAVMLPIRSRSMVTVGAAIDHADAGIPGDPGTTVVLLNPPFDGVAGFLHSLRADTNKPAPKHTFWLATGEQPLGIERPAADALILRPAGGFYPVEADRMLRDAGRPMPVGTVVALDGIAVEVAATDPTGRPTAAKFTFAAPLDDPRWAILRWSDHGFVPWELPPIGAADTLPAADLGKVMFPP